MEIFGSKPNRSILINFIDFMENTYAF